MKEKWTVVAAIACSILILTSVHYLKIKLKRLSVMEKRNFMQVVGEFMLVTTTRNHLKVNNRKHRNGQTTSFELFKDLQFFLHTTYVQIPTG